MLLHGLKNWKTKDILRASYRNEQQLMPRCYKFKLGSKNPPESNMPQRALTHNATRTQFLELTSLFLRLALNTSYSILRAIFSLESTLALARIMLS